MENNQPEYNSNQEQHTYTESWMSNQGSVPYNPFNSTGQVYGQTYQSTNIYGTVQNGPNPYLPKKSNGIGFSIAGMVCGIVSILSCFFMIFDLAIAVPGLILSIIALSNHSDGKGMAITGVICSACGILFSIVFMVICLCL